MRRCFVALVNVSTALILTSLPSLAFAGVPQQDATPPPEVSRIVEDLSPEERVGQLFVVTFQGRNVEPGTEIHTLLTRHHVGGVVLTAVNDNFDDSESLPASSAALTTALQQAIGEGAAPLADDEIPPAIPQSSIYIPLLIGVAHEGNDVARTDMRRGMTPLPSPMSLGATWNTDYARLVGNVTGAELSTLGINLLIGPTLDVLSEPRPSSPGDIGVRAFGGNSFWVGAFGRAYLEGVKSGGRGRIAVIAQHFPGLGLSDRDVASDIPTVNKPLSELFTIDIPPFVDVTNPSGVSDVVIDGLLAAHARYTALQGAVTTSTRPLNLDSQALMQLLSQPEMIGWRNAGGVVMSDRLGVEGLRRFYDPTGKIFPAFNIARDALLAGNDLLFVDEFGLNSSENQAATIIDTISLFVQKYLEDPAFAERVDAAVARIIALKLELYGEFSLDSVRPIGALNNVGQRTDEIFAIARDSVTLLSPAAGELANRLPNPPVRGEQVVFITDVLATNQCSTCVAVDELGVDDFEQAVTRLYGAGGSAQIRSTDISSFDFAALENLLSGFSAAPTEEPIAIETVESETSSAEATSEVTPEVTEAPQLLIGDALAEAEWIVFAVRDIPSEDAEANPLRRFLAERPDLVADRNIIVFALGAPYLLDATEVAQLSAYYGLYSHTSPFIEVAARVLFREIAPAGASPVSVPSISYDLESSLSPAVDQQFQLIAEVPGLNSDAMEAPQTATPTVPNAAESIPSEAPVLPEGTTVNVATTPLFDHNGHLVPDGTVVDFFVRNLAEGGLTQIFARTGTSGGVARATLLLGRMGRQEIWAQSGSAIAEPLQVEVFVTGAEGAPTIIVATITPEPTETVVPTETLILPTPTPILVVEVETPPVSTVELRDLLSASLALLLIGGTGWRLSRSQGRAISGGVKVVLAVAIGVGLGYNLYALSAPSNLLWTESLGSLASTVAAWTGGLIGLVLGRFWTRLREV